ncbi:MAG: hypothetical protein HKN26_04210 [Acidimicrobiales bacterium]|nr:hypothetical protein [Acidimicrobiales bacterium]
MSSDSAPLVVMAGMHRSGTSLLANALGRLGLHLGHPDALMGAAPSNVHGHGELYAVARLNDAILAACGAHWAAPLAIESARFDELAAGELGDRARSLLGAELTGVQLIKDPRFCLTLPFWRTVFAGRPLVLLTPWRHPQAVGRSLASRNDFPSAYGERLWTIYHHRLAVAATGLPRLIVAHRSVVDESVPTLTAVVRWLAEHGITADPPDTTTIALDPDSVHHQGDRDLTDSEQALLADLAADRPRSPVDDPIDDPIDDAVADVFFGAVAAFANQRDHYRFKLNELRARQQSD